MATPSGLYMKPVRQSNRHLAGDIALFGMLAAVIEVSKLALSYLPNVELVTFWIIMFTLYFGPRTVYSVLVFVLIEICIYGISTWVIMYFYIWPLLVLIVYLTRKADSIWFYSILSGFFGLFYGAVCAIPYIFIGATDGGIGSGLLLAFNWWVAGLRFDIVHGIANFALMLVLYTPVKKLFSHIPLPSWSREGKK